LIDSLTDAPIPAAIVVLEELNRETVAGQDGAFTFEGIPPGTYHLSVRAEGFSTRRTEVEVASSPVTIRVLVDVDLYFQEVMSVSPGARSQFESYQPTTVLSGQALAQQLEIKEVVPEVGRNLKALDGVSF